MGGVSGSSPWLTLFHEFSRGSGGLLETSQTFVGPSTKEEGDRDMGRKLKGHWKLSAEDRKTLFP